MQALVELGYGDKAVQQQPTRLQPSSSKEWAKALTSAIESGRVALTSCLVLGVPLMPDGPLRPVTLPCCGSVVSQIAASSILEEMTCTLCKAGICAGAAVLVNEAMSRAVAAQTSGFVPRMFQTSEVELGQILCSTVVGDVHEGQVNENTIAVKKFMLPVLAAVDPRYISNISHIEQVIAASYFAGQSSLYVCSMHGYCWTDKEMWYVAPADLLHERVGA